MSDNYALRALRQENARLKDENRTLRNQLLYLRDAIRGLGMIEKSLNKINAEANVFTLITRILTSALQAVNSKDGSLILLDEETNELVFVEVAGASREKLMGYRMPADQGIVGATLSSCKPTLVPDVRKDPKWFSQVDETIGFETLSIMCVPVMDGDNPLGAIEVVNKRNSKTFDQEDLDILLLVARLSAMALVRAEKVTQEQDFS